MYKGNRVAVVIPALDEEKAIGIVVRELLSLRHDGQGLIDDIVVCDNGSADSTARVAEAAGARVVFQSIAGYGIACLTAISHLAVCDIVLFVDGDDSCFYEQVLTLLEGVVTGDDLAIGSRTMGYIEPGALTHPQIFGNWLTSQLVALLWRHKISDLGPFRAIRYSSLQALGMKDKSFGWTIEMQVKAILYGMNVGEYSVDSKVRIGQSKISGTLSGSIKAGVGILSMLAKLFFTQTSLRARARKGGRLT